MHSGKYSPAQGEGNRKSWCTSAQMEEPVNMVYSVAQRKQVQHDECIVTLIALRMERSKKRKRVDVSRCSSVEGISSLVHKKDRLARYFVPIAESASKHKHLFDLAVWKSFRSRFLEPSFGISKIIDPASEFEKPVQGSAEIRICMALTCVEIAKGLPPFFNRFVGNRIRMIENRSTPTLIVERVCGCTLHEYLNRCAPERLPYVLESIFLQVVVALRCMRRYACFVHGDLHLENIMVQYQKDGDSMVFETTEETFLFPGDTPRVKIIDYGQSSMVDPTDGVSVHSFAGLMTQDDEGTDLARFCICLVKWAIKSCQKVSSRAWFTLLGEAVTDDIARVLQSLNPEGVTRDDIYRHAMTENKSTEWYSFCTDVCPADMIRLGSCSARFKVNASEARCSSPRNIFVERPDDYVRGTFSKSGTQHLTLSRHDIMGIDSLLRENFMKTIKSKLVERGIIEKSGSFEYDESIPFKKMDKKMNCEVHRALFFQGTDRYQRKRAALKALRLYQKSIVLYLRVFRDKKRDPDIVKMANALRHELEKHVKMGSEHEITLMFLCCYAICGEFSFFDDVDMDALRHLMRQRRTSDVKEVIGKLRERMHYIRDKIKTSTGGLNCDADAMTFAEVYDAKVRMKDLFFVSSQCTFYASHYV